MTAPRITVKDMNAARVPDRLSPAITRPRHLVEAVLAQSLDEMGTEGRAALAWDWALTGTRPSPVTLSLPVGHPPSRSEILAEAGADPEGSTAPPGVPADFCDQLGEARHILTWLAGATDEIPVDDEHRGRFIGARDDYARTDARHPPGPRQRTPWTGYLRPPRAHGPSHREEPLAMGCRLDERSLAPRRP